MTKILTYLCSALLWLLCVGIFVLLGPVFLLLSFVVRPERLHPVARLSCSVLLLCAGQRISVRGTFPDTREGPYLYLFNHCSMLDTLIMIAVIPEFTGALGKAEQFKIPIWGWILRRWGAIPVHRGKLQEAIKSVNEAKEIVRNGRSVLVAPEGTRSEDGNLGRFKKGPFHLARATDVKIVPLSIQGSYYAKRKGSWLLRPSRIEVRVGEVAPSHGQDIDSVDALIADVRARFVALGKDGASVRSGE